MPALPMSRGILALILLLPVLVAADDAPWFCHGIDCPKYKVVRSLDGDELELRAYEKGIWVSTNVTGLHYDTGVRMGFLRLFEYISGANEHGWKIPMTAPVRTLVTPGQGPFCEDHFKVSFFMPNEYQAGQKEPPAPNRDSVFIETTLAASYYVFSYPGFSSESKVVKHAEEVLAKLDELHEPYTAETFYTAGYDSPFRVLNRHNELWIPAADVSPDRVVQSTFDTQ